MELKDSGENTSIERLHYPGSRPVNVGRRVTPRTVAPDKFTEAFGTLTTEQMQETWNAKSRYEQSPTPSERQQDEEAGAEYWRVQREKQRRQREKQRRQPRQWGAADRHDAELAKQTNGVFYSRQYNLHVSFPGMSSGWQPPPPPVPTGPPPLPPSFHPQNQSTHPNYPRQVYWQSPPAHRQLAPVFLDDTVVMSPYEPIRGWR